MSKAKISLAGVSKSYISENEVTQALHKINLDLFWRVRRDNGRERWR